MSVIFGIRHCHGAVVHQRELHSLASATERYAPDGTFLKVSGEVGMGFQPLHTHERSTREIQPALDGLGNMLVFDGRLDNWKALRDLLGIDGDAVSDSTIVLTAFVQWGERCFSKFIGDWALSLWSGRKQVAYLARDHAGTRSLYFRNVGGVLLWSTYLETFFCDGSDHAIDERYAARYLAWQPICELTPYKDIQSVPPAHYLAIENGCLTGKRHWDPLHKEKIRHRSDEDYEAHFFSLFKESVERRTSPGAPILAQLSGGMDSTSIVCMSDRIRRADDPESALLDTVSFYDSSEPDWNEFPYFTIVEAARGKTGVHIETSFLDRSFEPPDFSRGRYLIPGADSTAIERERLFLDCISKQEYRTILSGVGGDEVLGGVPTPLPELADSLVSGAFNTLSKQALAWCLVTRSPFAHMLCDTIRFTLRCYLRPYIDRGTIPWWITPNLREHCVERAKLSEAGHKRFGVSPSAISNDLTWWSIMETLPHLRPSVLTRHEYRYPYLDRDLVDFLFAIPREQLVRPGRRRSLMRRALNGIVPTALLERRRKAIFTRGPLASLQNAGNKINELFTDSLAVERKYVDAESLRRACDLTINVGNPQWSIFLIRTIGFELWLRARAGPSANPDRGE